MPFPRVVIVDTDRDYLNRLQYKFAEEFFGRVELEVISDPNYFQRLFSTPQDADVLVICEGMYTQDLQRHNIGNVFILTELQDGMPSGGNVVCIAKYSSIRTILHEIVIRCPGLQAHVQKKGCQVVAVCSASGGVGKTTVALGISGCLAGEYKRVLYVNAGRLQSFQRVMKDQSPIASPDVYTCLAHPGEQVYEEVRHAVRTELFSYLPPFKASLLALDLPVSVYKKLVLSAKRSHDFDYVVVDMDTAFDENSAALMSAADRVVVVTAQTAASAYATNMLVANLNRPETDKYLFVCGNYRPEEKNVFSLHDKALRFTVSGYVEHFANYDSLPCEAYMDSDGIRKTAMLVM